MTDTVREDGQVSVADVVPAAEIVPVEQSIYVYSHKLRGRVADPVQYFGSNEWVKHLAIDLAHTMKQHKGVGIAAPQCGIFSRVVLVDWQDTTMIMVNPEIIRSEGKQKCHEGCLSVPGFIVDTERAVEVTVRTRTMVKGYIGSPTTITFSGFLAVIVQHEIDHLDGNFILQRTSSLKRGLVEKKLFKHVAFYRAKQKAEKAAGGPEEFQHQQELKRQEHTRKAIAANFRRIQSGKRAKY